MPATPRGPYGFQFVSVLAHDPVPDGEGGYLNVEEKADCIVNVHPDPAVRKAEGEIVRRGNEPDLVAYRAKTIAELEGRVREEAARTRGYSS